MVHANTVSTFPGFPILFRCPMADDGSGVRCHVCVEVDEQDCGDDVQHYEKDISPRARDFVSTVPPIFCSSGIE